MKTKIKIKKKKKVKNSPGSTKKNDPSGRLTDKDLAIGEAMKWYSGK